MIFFYCLLLYSIFSISFSQEEQIHDFLHLLRIRSLKHELISPDSTIDPLVTSQSGVCCKRTSVSHLVVKLHSLYRCRLVLLTPYACSPAIDDSVMIVAGRVCIVVFGSVSVPPLLGVSAPSVLCCCPGA